MNYYESLEESELIFLEFVGYLTGEDPKLILKNVGLNGTEDLFLKYIGEYRVNRGECNFQKSITYFIKERSKLDFSNDKEVLEQEISKLQAQLTDKKSLKVFNILSLLVIGIFIGLISAFLII